VIKQLDALEREKQITTPVKTDKRYALTVVVVYILDVGVV
jgi:hypothetical protein